MGRVLLPQFLNTYLNWLTFKQVKDNHQCSGKSRVTSHATEYVDRGGFSSTKSDLVTTRYVPLLPFLMTSGGR